MAITILERAKRAFYRGRYNDVLTILEPNVLQYRDSFQFYYFLALACLHTGDIGGAQSYFQRARQIKMRDPDLLSAQAALFLRRGETHQAVEYYLEALEYDPGHALSRRSLDFIRKKASPEVISCLVETGKIARFYPRPRPPFPIMRVLAAVAAVTLMALVVPVAFKAVQAQGSSGSRADLSALRLTGTEKSGVVEMGGTYRYILTEREILDSYGKAQKFFQAYRDNAAQIEINRILNSNAGAAVKHKARLLMEYVGEPGFDSVRDVPAFDSVSRDPYLYLDCWVTWKGMATNVALTEHWVRFDFLVGYDSRSKLEGIVPVAFEEALSVDPERPLEILARVTLDNGKLSLAGKAIHQSVAPR